MLELAKITDPTKPDESLRDVTIVVTHIKPGNNASRVINELQKDNKHHFRFLIPQQGKLLVV